VFRGLNRTGSDYQLACNLPEFADETIECINRSDCLSPDARFQYVIGNVRCGFAADARLSSTEMIQIIHRSGDWPPLSGPPRMLV
jgi:hypothetical protein